MPIGRKEAVAVAAAVVLVIAAFVVPRLHLGIVTPLINAGPQRFRDFADTAPIFGWWHTHVGPGTGPAIAIAVAAVLWGPTLAQRLPWRWLPPTAWLVSCAWAFSLAMIDGWQRGFAGRLTARHEYLRQVPTVTDIPEALRTFADRILDYQPDSWITHVSGHPPGALLTFVWLDRVGLGGGAWAGLLCLLAGSSIAAAIVVTVRALADEDTARAAAPFVAVTPAAIWIAVSADGYFAGVAAWGIALLALAVTGTARVPALAAGRRGPAARVGHLLQLRAGPDGPARSHDAAQRAHSACRPDRLSYPRSSPRSRSSPSSPQPASGGSTATSWCRSATGRASPTTGRSNTGAGPIWPRWSARSGWAASPGWPGSSTSRRCGGAPVCICSSPVPRWRFWWPTCRG